MKILNKTNFRTKDIRNMLEWCLKRSGMQGKNLVVEIVETRRNQEEDFIGGYAYYGKGDFSRRNYIMLKFPKRALEINPFELAHTFMHELAHTRGIKHDEMKIYLEEEDVPTFEIKRIPEPAQYDLIMKDILRLEKMLKKKNTKASYILTSIKKTEKKIARLKRRLDENK